MGLLRGPRRTLLGGARTTWGVLLAGGGNINFGSGANIDDLPDGGAITLDFWLRISNTPGAQRTVISKGLQVRPQAGGALRLFVYYDGTNARVGTTTNLCDNRWHHLRFTYDEGGDRRPRAWVDGIEESGIQVASVGNYTSDAAASFVVTGHADYDVTIGWLTYSDIVRGTTNFIPPNRASPPANDANYQLLIPMNDGAGATVADLSGNGYNGTITGGVWVKIPV